MNYLPINIKLTDQNVLVLGGGNIASRKIESLLKSNARVTCIALKFNQKIHDMKQNINLKLIKHDLIDLGILKKFNNIKLIYSALDNKKLNHNIYQYAHNKNLLVNTVDQPQLCDFISPAVLDHSPIVISISSEGAAPILTRIIKQKIEFLLPKQLSKVAKLAEKLRLRIKNSIPEFNNRKRFWERFFKWSHQSQTIFTDQYQIPNKKETDRIIQQVNQFGGRVSLVGAGPGNPELLTLKAVKVLQTADIVLHDQLISGEILDMIRKDAHIIDVGKQAGNHKTKQERINQLLIKFSKDGLHVCRLKGGDSFVFGRGGEEVLSLVKENIEFEIVPGITAAVGCAAYAGIPLTHRNHAQSLAFMTAHCSDSIDTIDWQFYAKNNQTLAVYMGLIKAEKLVSELINHGKLATEYTAIIENGTRQNQRTILGQLIDLPDMIKDNKVKSPALIVIGEVAQYAANLDWFKPHLVHNSQPELKKLLKIA